MEWKDRLCGSAFSGNSEKRATLEQLLISNKILSCGGGYFPVTQNSANMSTTQENCILPTQKYSILVFNEEGHAVIYSEDEEVGLADKPEF